LRNPECDNLDASDLGEAAWSLGGMALAVALALGLLRLTTAVHAIVAPQDAGVVPVLHVTALGAGACLGLALLLATPDAEAFRPARLFDAEGPWMVGLGGFLRLHALPGPGTAGNLLAAMRGLDGLAGIAGWVAVLPLLGGCWIAFRGWRGRARLRALLAFLLMAGLGALLLHYAVQLLAWLTARLGFWVFALLLLGFQRWRHAPRGAH
jgi:hypothetical protein